MKTYRYILLGALAIGSISKSFSQKGYLELTVHAPNTKNSLVTVTAPIQGYYFEGNKRNFHLDTLSFKRTQQIPLDGLSIISISNDYREAKLIVRPGQHAEVSFLANGDLSIQGDNAQGQHLYNQITADNTRSRFEELDVSPTVAGRLLKLDSMQQLDHHAITSLANKGQIDPDFTKKLKSESEMYYRLLWSTDLFFTCRSLVYGEDPNTSKVNPEFVTAWKAMYKDIDDTWASSPFFTLLMSRYSSLLSIGNAYERENSKPWALTELEKLKPLLKDRLLEYTWANFIVLGLSNNENERVWLTNFDEFKQRFPNSPIISVLTPALKQVEDYHAKLLIDTPGVIFMDNTAQYTSLKDLMKGIKGKFYYVDLWATWCGPCKAELQHSIKLHDELEKIGFTPLYLSLDNEKANEKWKEMVKGFPLKGLNMRTGEALHKGINQEVPKFTGIPRYLIVDKNGDIVNWDALRPSDGSALIKQLQSYLK
ncbi:TlpA family protein disulfide reductase [Sphingobacterium tabacisoli]|uniref:TlpA family protein disulfide reductase n=1 Tax=Sphingobacterium tabacisoli TaxID=2044855 RepID=A0ABW5L9I2_9SPHI|nr:TlpA disulfide reductase family protein [Sphingobacterium tabacisoli]